MQLDRRVAMYPRNDEIIEALPPLKRNNEHMVPGTERCDMALLAVRRPDVDEVDTGAPFEHAPPSIREDDLHCLLGPRVSILLRGGTIAGGVSQHVAGVVAFKEPAELVLQVGSDPQRTPVLRRVVRARGRA